MGAALWLGLLALVAIAAAEFDYCRISSEHTMCQYKGPSPSCRGLVYRPLNQRERLAVLRTHNLLRNRVAAGRQRGQPTASDMHRLRWDNELATVALRWAVQCKFRHDKNRNAADGTYVGQNLMMTSDRRSSVVKILRDATRRSWFSEVRRFDGRSAYKPYVFHLGTGHYTQLVWARTQRLGCAVAQFNVGNDDMRMVVCNYREGGNFLGRAMYSPGQPASHCGGKGRDRRYKSLCA